MKKLNVYLFIITSILLNSLSTKAKNHCQLQPENYDGKFLSLKKFENNIEKEMTAIYQKEHPAIQERIKKRNQVRKQIQTIYRQLYRKYIRPIGNHRSFTVTHLRKKERRRHLSSLIQEDITSEEEFLNAVNTHWIRSTFNFSIYRKNAKIINQNQALMNQLNLNIQPIPKPHFLYPPKTDFFIHNNDLYYGNVNLEAFFNLPKDDLFIIPLLGIGFETNKNTVIYTCIHLDAFQPEKNIFYIYFLNTTKFYMENISELLFNLNLAARHIITLGTKPKAIISPLPLKSDPTNKVIQPLMRTLKIFNWTEPLEIISSITSKLDAFFNLSNIHPTMQLVLDNVDFGIKGLHISADGILMRYAATSLYGLLNVNLTQYKYKIDTSSLTNIITLKTEESIVDSDESQDESIKD